MSFKENLKETLNILPESIKQTIHFCFSPGIIDDNVKNKRALRNFVEVALMTGAIMALLKSALPNTITLDVAGALNPFILTVSLILNGLVFSILFFGLASLAVYLRERSGLKAALFYQPIKLFTAYNILLPILVVTALNRIAVASSLNIPVNGFDLWCGLAVALTALWLAIRTLVNPVAEYFGTYYHKKLAVTLALLSTVLALTLNPALKAPLLDHLIDKRKICEFLVEKNHNRGLLDGTVNFHQKLLECLQNF